ncbi:LytTR family DNA-binding domain-containing protein [Allosphingosinicella deserti]|nr:LytTR family DNA-binding domain-containing protein [Sphingomonas deserti]
MHVLLDDLAERSWRTIRLRREQGFANGRTGSRAGEPRYRGAVTPDPTRAPVWLKWLLTTTCVGLILGLIGPYGSYLNGPAHVRIFYWIGMSWLGMAILMPSIIVALRLARRWALPQWLTIGVAMILAAIPLSAAIALIATALWPELTFLGPADWYAQVLFVCLLQGGAYLLVARRGADVLVTSRPAVPSHDSATPAGPSPPAVSAAAPLCLQMEDHYVRIHGATGSRLEHSTLAQAIADYGTGEGLQIHRSWWVARSAIAEIVPDGRSVKIRLTNGVVAPVSRSRLAALRAAGWLEDAKVDAPAE